MNRLNRIALAAGAGLAGAVMLAGAAQAAIGHVTGTVNFRTGPGVQYRSMGAIPAGSPVDVLGCPSWCQVAWRGQVGWVSSNYVSVGGGYGAYVPPPPPVYVVPPYRPSFGIYIGPDRRWDRRYDRRDRWDRHDRRRNWDRDDRRRNWDQGDRRRNGDGRRNEWRRNN